MTYFHIPMPHCFSNDKHNTVISLHFFLVTDLVRHELACPVTVKSLKLESLGFKKQQTKLFYPCSENKVADMRLCFPIYKAVLLIIKFLVNMFRSESRNMLNCSFSIALQSDEHSHKKKKKKTICICQNIRRSAVQYMYLITYSLTLSQHAMFPLQ